ncbi:hypothetical protein K3759_15450 [Sulfitobacter sp. W027]|uniref:hypothetical protein n=1 Tax=Sulfitobacter sp. W027 TaxID=2867025 RepID=UPI0021A974A0|nr:hypothetical protein [Sulfitobacter sp. W027]UWR33313.1 hypothetical protein K3759_15450 [Sulfitobacter sp. W027]
MSEETLNLLKVFTPVLLGILTIVGGFVLYGRQKSLDRKNEILQERRQLYRKFVGLAQQLQTHRLTGSEAAAKTDYPKFKIVLAELMVTAPDHVVKPLQELDRNIAALLSKRFGGNPKTDHFGVENSEADLAATVSASFNEAVSEMRLDSFSDSQFSKAFFDQILNASIAVVGARIR